MIDITTTHDDLYDLMVRELRASEGMTVTGASGPVREVGPETINRESIMRVAYLMSHGVRVSSAGGPFRVLGAASEGVAGPWDGKPLPRAAFLSEDLQGHVEVYGPFKVAYRRCVTCGGNFTVKRAASVRARWASYCGDKCRRAEYAARKRQARA